MKISVPSANLLVAIAALLWGTSFVVIRWGLLFIDPLLFAFLRFVLATIMFLPIAVKKISGLGKILLKGEIIVIGFFNAMAFFFQFLGQGSTTAGLASLFVNFYVIIVPLLSPLFLKEKFNLKIVISAFIGFLGVFFVTTNLDFSDITQASLVGNTLSLVASIAWTGYILVSKKYLDTDPAMSSMAVFFGSIAWSSIFLTAGLPFVFIKTPLSEVGAQFTWQSIISLLYLALFCTVGAFLLYLYALKRGNVGESTIFLLLEIVVAFGIEFILHAINPDLWTIDVRIWTVIGTVMILSAVASVSVDFSHLKSRTYAKKRVKEEKKSTNTEL